MTEAENEGDPCIGYMREGTDEAKKVKRNQGKIWHAVFRKREAVKDSLAITETMMNNFFN